MYFPTREILLEGPPFLHAAQGLLVWCIRTASLLLPVAKVQDASLSLGLVMGDGGSCTLGRLTVT